MSRNRAWPQPSTRGPDRVSLLGVGVDALGLEQAAAIVESWIAKRSRHYVCVTGAHGIMEARNDPELRAILARAGLVTPDGMPLVWLLRLSGRKRTERVYGPDLMRRLTHLSAANGYRQFYYGGGPGVAEMLSQTLTTIYPTLSVAGIHCPPFRQLTPQEDAAVVSAINSSKPDILWVGLSTPKQEHWMASHVGRIEAPAMIGVGAAFDFLAGTKRQAPVWVQRCGMEWLYRLCSEPRRLWRRYLYIVPGFGLLAAAEGLRLVIDARRRRLREFAHFSGKSAP